MRQWNTRTSASLCGTSAARTKSGHFGVITSRTPRQVRSLNIQLIPYFQGLIFVVDSNDRERITEAQEELQKMVHVMAIIDDSKQC